MNVANENQHYVSRVLLTRFKTPGSPLNSYNVETGEWKLRSVEKACAAAGYNQWVVGGLAENTFEACFSHVESQLPKTFRALAEAVAKKAQVLEAPVYENMCRYCAMLKLSSPAAKACAVASLVIQINWEVENGQRSLLRELEVPEVAINEWKREFTVDRRIIIESDNVTQFAFRLHYSRTCDIQFQEFLRSDWTISEAPFDLPISDIGLVPIHLTSLQANQYLLPISPRLLLEGIHYFDQTRNSREPKIRTHSLSEEEAQIRHESICLSAVAEVISTSRDQKIPKCFERRNCGLSDVGFHRVTNPHLMTTAGTKNSNGNYRLRTVPMEEYRKFVYSFITPR